MRLSNLVMAAFNKRRCMDCKKKANKFHSQLQKQRNFTANSKSKQISLQIAKANKFHCK